MDMEHIPLKTGFIWGILILDKDMVWELLISHMVTGTKDYGTMALIIKALISGLNETSPRVEVLSVACTLVNSTKIMNFMVKELDALQMEVILKDFFVVETILTVVLSGQMGASIQELLFLVYLMGLVFIVMPMVENIKEVGKKGKNMVLVFFTMLMEEELRDFGKWKTCHTHVPRG